MQALMQAGCDRRSLIDLAAAIVPVDDKLVDGPILELVKQALEKTPSGDWPSKVFLPGSAWERAQERQQQAASLFTVVGAGGKKNKAKRGTGGESAARAIMKR
eukprot:COSAG04_NODE_23880_length_330_cov_1.324675_1_plen_103_part_01